MVRPDAVLSPDAALARGSRYLSRTRLAAFVAAGAVSAVLLPSRLLGLHGVESALVLGLLLPPFTGALGAAHARRVRALGSPTSFLAVARRATRDALGVVGLAAAVLALNGLRFRQCDPWEGLAFLLLGPACGAAFAAWLGVVAGAWLPGRAAMAAGVLTPVAALVAGLSEFWRTPSIAVLGHFAGWFPGTLYDDDVTLPATFVSFRLVTAATAIGVGALTAAGWKRGHATIRRVRHAPALVLVAIVFLGGAAMAYSHGPELGHRTTAAYIQQELGMTKRGARCIVHAPRELPAANIDRLVADCDHRVRRAEQGLGVHQSRPVHAYFYRSAEEKRRLMGAGRTLIAKPWRDEVHLQLREWPHPVLAHEIVHVVASNAAEGPFRVSGTFGGWLPNPGLIEGTAVAIAWDVRDGLDPDQGARALRELGLLPPIDQVLSLSFLQLPASLAYATAGSFVAFLRRELGRDALRASYRLGDVTEATGQDLRALEHAWHAHLDGVTLPPGALDLARVRYERRSIFAAPCPHRLARLRIEMAGDLAAGDAVRTIETCQRYLDIAPYDAGVQALLVGALAREGAESRADQALDHLVDALDAPTPIVVSAREARADADWARGHPERALESYRALLALPQSEDRARNLEVKILGLEAGGQQAELLFMLLVGDGRGVGAPVAVHIARELSAAREDGLGPYLEARQMLFQSHYELARTLLAEAQRRGLPTERLTRENERLLGIAQFATGDLSRAETTFRGLLGRPWVDPEARDWLARIADARAH